jgi:DNA polymerase-3 subunit delta'
MDDNNAQSPKHDYPWHDSSWEKFVTARSRNHLPHALLISGSEGIGKLGFAKKIVNALLCTSPVDNQACQNCKSCKTYQANANPDFINIELLEDKQQISVDQIRKLSDFINYTRSYNAYRVVLINPVERMNKNAANSLLKSLEEPAENTVIILVATSLGNILPTIKSRCQLLTLPSPSNQQASLWVKEYSKHTNPEVLLSIANGQPLTALTITDDEIQNRVELAADLLSICKKQITVTEIAKKWEKQDHAMLLNWQITWLQKFIKNNNIESFSADDEQGVLATTLEELKTYVSDNGAWELYQQLIHQKQYIHTSVNALLFSENMLMLWLQANRSG